MSKDTRERIPQEAILPVLGSALMRKRVGEVFKLSDMAKETDIDPRTVEKWMRYAYETMQHFSSFVPENPSESSFKVEDYPESLFPPRLSHTVVRILNTSFLTHAFPGEDVRLSIDDFPAKDRDSVSTLVDSDYLERKWMSDGVSARYFYSLTIKGLETAVTLRRFYLSRREAWSEGIDDISRAMAADKEKLEDISRYDWDIPLLEPGSLVAGKCFNKGKFLCL